MEAEHVDLALSSMHVLVIEDNEFQRAALVAGLRSLGVEHVSTAGDGHAALALMKQHRQGYDLAVCDLQMEGMDGVEFMRHSAKLDLGGVILLSGMDSDLLTSAEIIAVAYGVPLVGRLCKPVNLSALKHLLLHCLRKPPRQVRDTASGPKLPAFSSAELTSALSRGEFVPYFQPKVDLATRRVHGAEMLARWRHPDLGILGPDVFIDHMERINLVSALTDSLFEQTMQQVVRWRDDGVFVPIAINASAQTLQDVRTASRLNEMARTYRVSPNSVTVELTETVLAHDDDSLLETLLRLRLNGFGISLDDFGTGFSSLQQLSRIPFTEIKLDRSFVTGAQHNPRVVAILDSVTSLTRTLGLRVVAEGIETQEDLSFIQTLGVEIGQGYLFSRPLDAAPYLAWHKSFK